jgi:hypothetical protein
MSGAIPPIPQYAFMAWCLVKAQGQLYLYLLEGTPPLFEVLVFNLKKLRYKIRTSSYLYRKHTAFVKNGRYSFGRKEHYDRNSNQAHFTETVEGKFLE